jgi:hypothetical protein
MAERPTNDAKASRREACELLGFGDDPSRLCPADRLKVDLVSTLRLVIDHAGEVVLDGGTADLGRLVTAVEHLTRMLPAAREPLASQRDDRDAAVAPLLKLFRHLHESVHTLSAENAHLKAALKAGSPALPDVATLVESVPIDPGEADITPPGEIGGECYAGMRPGPDDPPRRSPPVIVAGDTCHPQKKTPFAGHEGRAVRLSPTNPPAAPAAVAPAPRSAAPYDYSKERGWRDHVLPDGTITPVPMSRGRWWGPV